MREHNNQPTPRELSLVSDLLLAPVSYARDLRSRGIKGINWGDVILLGELALIETIFVLSSHNSHTGRIEPLNLAGLNAGLWLWWGASNMLSLSGARSRIGAEGLHVNDHVNGKEGIQPRLFD